jgi:hypothetical protein
MVPVDTPGDPGRAEALGPSVGRNSPGVDETETVEMFRPVGPRELARIRELGSRAFPPRLSYQPIFYPVLNEAYARKIARDWNATKPDTGYRGFVTRFHVRADYAARFAVQTVGASWAQELWVPAEDIDEFNDNIVGLIEVIVTFQGSADAEPVEVEADSAHEGEGAWR